MTWTKDWPTELGFYWAYGISIYDIEQKIELSIVRVPYKDVLIRGSEFLYRHENKLLFKKIKLPKLPNFNELYNV